MRGRTWIVVCLWYSLGVVSIATSKVLLKTVSPIALTFQQFLIGSIILRTCLRLQQHNKKNSTDSTEETTEQRLLPPQQQRHLNFAGLSFSFGFFATNLGFSGAAASFVETIKAAEPITSAALTYVWGLEASITVQQVLSLVTIMGGVILASRHQGQQRQQDDYDSSNGSATTITTSDDSSISTTLWWQSILFVMVANLCFSFRGLFQKLAQQGGEPKQHNNYTTDIQLQIAMQWIGVKLLLFPAAIEGLYYFYNHDRDASNASATHTLPTIHVLEYLWTTILNGGAFTAYNLASTYILSRLSVVHHASLNCIRRVFAIVVTSVLFGVPITPMGALGIFIALVGFMSYTHFKVQQRKQVQLEGNDEVLPLKKAKIPSTALPVSHT